MEHWLPVVGYEGLYEVSDLGRVRTVARSRLARGPLLVDHYRHYPSRVLPQRLPPRDGYCRVTLTDAKGSRPVGVGPLVLTAFVGPKPPGLEAAHWDGNQANNTLGNLRWATPTDNAADKIRHGTNGRGEQNAAAKLTWDEVRQIRKLRRDGFSRSKVGTQFGIGYWHVRDIDTGRIWQE